MQVIRYRVGDNEICYAIFAWYIFWKWYLIIHMYTKSIFKCKLFLLCLCEFTGKILLIGSNIILLICFYILKISMHVSIVWIFYTIKEGEENTAENTIYISSSIQKQQLLCFTAVADVIAKDRMFTLLASWLYLKWQ